MSSRQNEPFWHVLFFVTAGSFFLFSTFVKVLGGSTSHAFLFFKVALVCVGMGVFMMLRELAKASPSRKR